MTQRFDQTVPTEFHRECLQCQNRINYRNVQMLKNATKRKSLCKICGIKNRSEKIKGAHWVWTREESRKLCAESHKNSAVWVASMNTAEYKKKQSETKSGEKNGMFGKAHSTNTKQKLSTLAKNRFENLEERKKISDGLKLAYKDPEIKRRMIEAANKPDNLEGKRKRRLKQIKESGGFPAFSYTACDFFSKVNQKLNWNGQFATFGGEKEIGGYSVDYFVPEKNLVIEWDEEAHFRDKPTREKHAKRQEILLAIGVKFYRIREKTLGITKVDLYSDNYLDKLLEVVNG